ncbi:MAG: LTA synthase family protein, partial [Bacilli bacterium]|nr:LTA synthase family protein [Bacilli bacterium]
LFLSLFILDLTLRIFYINNIKFYNWYYLVPNLFSLLWISFILGITKNLKNKIGVTFYLFNYILYLIIYISQSIYFSYFTSFYDFSVLEFAGEGAAYFDTVLLNVKYWVIITVLLSVYLTIKGLKIIKYNSKIKIKKIIYLIIIFIVIHLITPSFLGQTKKSISWDDWRNPRSIYKSFNDNNKSFMISGLYEYTFRDFYITYIKKNNKLTLEEEKVLKENFISSKIGESNKYTGIFSGKNLILIQLESIENFLITKEIMPTTYKMMNSSINFVNHYSFTSGGGSTFNSEFMVNTGYSSAYNYNQSAYSFSRNNYKYSLPNILKEYNYESNAFHMNTSEYYSRGANYKSFGYKNYYGLKDQDSYKGNTNYWLDRELILNSDFNKLLFSAEDLFMNYIITYSAHMPFSSSKGTCSKLTDKVALTELECLKIQAKETDYFMKLLLEDLEKKDKLNDTVIVVFSDHYLYTLENKNILDDYKTTDNQLINHTPFFIWTNKQNKQEIKKVNSQLDILPTILNLMGVKYYSNYYLGEDILSDSFYPLVFFPDGSWYNGFTYVKDGKYLSGKKMEEKNINDINLLVKRKMALNDAVMKSDFFNKINSIRN